MLLGASGWESEYTGRDGFSSEGFAAEQQGLGPAEQQSAAGAEWRNVLGLGIPLTKLPVELKECLAQQPQLPEVPGSPSFLEDKAADKRLLHLP